MSLGTVIGGSGTGQFRYTPGTDEKLSGSQGRLTQKQREFYDQNGFIVIPKLVSEELLDQCRERFLDLINGRVEKGEEDHELNIHECMHVYVCM